MTMLKYMHGLITFQISNMLLDPNRNFFSRKKFLIQQTYIAIEMREPLASFKLTHKNKDNRISNETKRSSSTLCLT